MAKQVPPNRIPVSLVSRPSQKVLDEIRRTEQSENASENPRNQQKVLDKDQIVGKVLTMIWFCALFVSTAMASDALARNLSPPDMGIAIFLPAMLISVMWVILSGVSWMAKLSSTLGCLALLVFCGQLRPLLSSQEGLYAGLTLVFTVIWAGMIRFVGYGFVKPSGGNVVDPSDPIRSFGKAKQLGLLSLLYILVFSLFYQVLKSYSSEMNLADAFAHPFGVALTLAFITSIFVSRLVVRFLTIGGGFLYILGFGFLGLVTLSGKSYEIAANFVASVDQSIRESSEATRIQSWEMMLSAASPFLDILTRYWQPIYVLAGLLIAFLLSMRWLGIRIDVRGAA
jgi:hypothetical protein